MERGLVDKRGPHREQNPGPPSMMCLNRRVGIKTAKTASDEENKDRALDLRTGIRGNCWITGKGDTTTKEQSSGAPPSDLPITKLERKRANYVRSTVFLRRPFLGPLQTVEKGGATFKTKRGVAFGTLLKKNHRVV